MMRESEEKFILRQGLLLALAGILTKIIGFAYRIPVANLLGSAGNGIYSVSFGIYNIALTLSSCSLPLAVSKLVSARLARHEGQNARRVFFDALLYALLIGAIAALALYFGADALERFYKRAGLALPLRVLAPTSFVVALLGVFRGYFQGHGSMIPTAISQVLEQLINALVSVFAAGQLMRLYRASPLVSAYGAAGSTLGTFAGALTALGILAILFALTRERSCPPMERETHGHIAKMLLLTVIPVIFSQTIYQIGYTLDDLLFGNLMAAKGFSDGAIAALQGVFNTQYNQLVNLPVALATAMAASAVPGIVASYARRETKVARRKMTAVLKLNLAVAIPAAVGLAVLAQPIITLLFPRLPEDAALAARLLQFGSSAAVFYALSTITTAILQASDRMQLPLLHCAAALAVHVGLVYGLLRFTPLGVYALLLGNVTFPLMVALLNCRSLSRELGYRWKIGRMLAVPLAAAGAMGAVAWGVHAALLPLLGAIPALLAALCAAIAVYGLLILKLHCFSNRQLLDLPMGTKLLALTKKLEGNRDA